MKLFKRFRESISPWERSSGRDPAPPLRPGSHAARGNPSNRYKAVSDNRSSVSDRPRKPLPGPPLVRGGRKSTPDKGGWGVALALCAALSALSGPALAEPKSQDAGLKEVLRKAQGVLHKLSEEKAALEAEKATLLGDKAALEDRVKKLEESVRKLETLPAEVERCKAGAESLQGAKAELESQIGQARDKEQGLLRKQREIVAEAREIQADNQLLVEAVKEREQWIGQCGRNNRQLLDANRELLEKYKDKGFWDKIADLEPLTGIGKVVTENAAEDYRYRLHQLKATPFQPQAPAPAEPPPDGAPAPAESGAGGEP